VATGFLGLNLEDILAGTRFLTRLPSFLRRRVRLEEARATLGRRLACREADFLAFVRGAIYEHPESPYRQLLGWAGCAYGDLERLVLQDGLETALGVLREQGVYLTVRESRGLEPVVRGSLTMRIDPGQLVNPSSARHVPTQSSGSRDAPLSMYVDLAFIRDFAVNLRLFLDARGGMGWHQALWEVPGSSAMLQLLQLRSLGAVGLRWFSQVEPAAPGLHPRYRLSAHALRWMSALAGPPLPLPAHVPLDDPTRIGRWLTEVRRAGGFPHLKTYGSAAVCLARWATEHGTDLAGVQLSVSGEPITEARMAMLRRTGAQVVPRWGSRECGPIGYGCLRPHGPDDLHLLDDLHAFIQIGPEGAGPGLPPGLLLVSSLRRTAPIVLLNVSLGDRAVVDQRACGCPMATLGWRTHVSTIRSYEKLTAAGMSFLDSDVLRVLEEVLPTRFGGSPLDYQLVDEDTTDGRPRLRLLVHPRVPVFDPAAMTSVFLAEIGGGSGVERIMGLVWRDAQVLAIERRAPEISGSGKVLPIHRRRLSSATAMVRP
jgi:hypothetical protein